MTLGGAAKAGVRLIVWWKNCQHQLEPDPAEPRWELLGATLAAATPRRPAATNLCWRCGCPAF